MAPDQFTGPAARADVLVAGSGAAGLTAALTAAADGRALDTEPVDLARLTALARLRFPARSAC